MNRIICSATIEYISFSNTQETLSRIDNILGYKLSINKFKKINNIQSIFSDDNRIKLKINNKEKWKIHKFVIIKKYILKQPMGQ